MPLRSSSIWQSQGSIPGLYDFKVLLPPILLGRIYWSDSFQTSVKAVSQSLGVTINCGKFWKRWECQTTWPSSWETGMQVRKKQLELYMEQDWFQIGNMKFQIGKGTRQGCILSPSLFNLHAEYFMRNTGLKEAQAGIKIVRRNINNLRYADDTTLIAKSEEELKSLLIKVKEESEKVGLKLNIQKSKIMASGPITSLAKRWGNSGNSERLYFSRLQNHCR